eukprot:TRINITY_DN4997_c1_g1_i1.p1 TRINITY_DN4997_c1_g1~~TRINITY_DN4997_c1_g1_i1.p1  ORF type:complete len:1741 (+),score=156.62 TRINITY_DN4997_c1_g1_i1:98-5320(+)
MIAAGRRAFTLRLFWIVSAAIACRGAASLGSFEAGAWHVDSFDKSFADESLFSQRFVQWDVFCLLGLKDNPSQQALNQFVGGINGLSEARYEWLSSSLVGRGNHRERVVMMWRADMFEKLADYEWALGGMGIAPGVLLRRKDSARVPRGTIPPFWVMCPRLDDSMYLAQRLLLRDAVIEQMVAAFQGKLMDTTLRDDPDSTTRNALFDGGIVMGSLGLSDPPSADSVFYPDIYPYEIGMAYPHAAHIVTFNGMRPWVTKVSWQSLSEGQAYGSSFMPSGLTVVPSRFRPGVPSEHTAWRRVHSEVVWSVCEGGPHECMAVAEDAQLILVRQPNADWPAAIRQLRSPEEQKIVICEVPIGIMSIHEPDYNASLTTDPAPGGPSTRWLNFYMHKDAAVAHARNRLMKMRDLGCDGVLPGSLDCYLQGACYTPLAPEGVMAEDVRDAQASFNAAVADEAHRLGLSVGLLGNHEFVQDLALVFDFAVSFNCITGTSMVMRCASYHHFISQQKAVLVHTLPDNFPGVCSAQESSWASGMRSVSLTAEGGLLCDLHLKGHYRVSDEFRTKDFSAAAVPSVDVVNVGEVRVAAFTSVESLGSRYEETVALARSVDVGCVRGVDPLHSEFNAFNVALNARGSFALTSQMLNGGYDVAYFYTNAVEKVTTYGSSRELFDTPPTAALFRHKATSQEFYVMCPAFNDGSLRNQAATLSNVILPDMHSRFASWRLTEGDLGGFIFVAVRGACKLDAVDPPTFQLLAPDENDVEVEGDCAATYAVAVGPATGWAIPATTSVITQVGAGRAVEVRLVPPPLPPVGGGVTWKVVQSGVQWFNNVFCPDRQSNCLRRPAANEQLVLTKRDSLDDDVVAALRINQKLVMCTVYAGGPADPASPPPALHLVPVSGEYYDVSSAENAAAVRNHAIDVFNALATDGVCDGVVLLRLNREASDFQLAFNVALADAAHQAGLTAGILNDDAQAPLLAEAFDFAVTSCTDASCDDKLANYSSFTAQNKAVLVLQTGAPACPTATSRISMLHVENGNRWRACPWNERVIIPSGYATLPITQAPATPAPATQSPITQAPATPAPETMIPATPAPATWSPATQAPAPPAPPTPAPVTPAPPTPSPVTQAPATPAPPTPAPVTPAPPTPSPVTQAPATPAPPTPAPVTPAPPTPSPVTQAPATPAPGTVSPATPAPATPSPVTQAPATPAPATPAPAATLSPVTLSPLTEAPATPSSPTPSPVTQAPKTPAPATPAPVLSPVTSAPSTLSPITPATATPPSPATPAPATQVPATAEPPTPIPPTLIPPTPGPPTPIPPTPEHPLPDSVVVDWCGTCGALNDTNASCDPVTRRCVCGPGFQHAVGEDNTTAYTCVKAGEAELVSVTTVFVTTFSGADCSAFDATEEVGAAMVTAALLLLEDICDARVVSYDFICDAGSDAPLSARSGSPLAASNAVIFATFDGPVATNLTYLNAASRQMLGTTNHSDVAQALGSAPVFTAVPGGGGLLHTAETCGGNASLAVEFGHLCAVLQCSIGYVRDRASFPSLCVPAHDHAVQYCFRDGDCTFNGDASTCCDSACRVPNTGAPTTGEPTTGRPSTGAPGVPRATGQPTTGEPTTGVPTTGAPCHLRTRATYEEGSTGTQPLVLAGFAGAVSVIGVLVVAYSWVKQGHGPTRRLTNVEALPSPASASGVTLPSPCELDESEVNSTCGRFDKSEWHPVIKPETPVDKCDWASVQSLQTLSIESTCL